MILLILCGVFLGLMIIGMPIAWALAGAVVAVFYSGAFPLPPAWLGQQLFRGMDSISLASIPLFLFAGGVMNEGGLTRRIIAVADACLGWMRGGLGPVNVGTGMIYGGISGSATADTGAVGTIMIPAMRERGYPVGFAAALQATAAELSVLIPPSIPMIIYGLSANVSVGDLFLAGIGPGILVAIAAKHKLPVYFIGVG